ERVVYGRQVILRERARVRSRIGQYLVFFVQRLRKRKRRPRRQAEAAVRFPLKTGQIVEKGRDLRGRLGLFRDDARLAFAVCRDRSRFGLVTEPLRARVGVIFDPLELFVEPPPLVRAAGRNESTEYFPVCTGLKRANLFF